MSTVNRLVESGLLPDFLIRHGIRTLDRQHLADEAALSEEALCQNKMAFIAAMRDAPVALVPERANEQHYECPAAFFRLALGERLKYSSAYFPEENTTLDEAEVAALKQTVEHAHLRDGQRVLELGCGWGSLTLWMAEHYPASRITAVSNSASQRESILADADRRGLDNVEVITADMNRFAPDGRFDRIVSVEMFEHMRNWQVLFSRVADWLEEDGRFLMHIFVHRHHPYIFEAGDSDDDWMSRFFFAGGMMPSDDLPLWFQDQLQIVQQWRWDGTHYQRTAEGWLANLDARRDEAMAVLRKTYGEEDAAVWLQRWRIFFMACAELWGLEEGRAWWVSHYLFKRR